MLMLLMRYDPAKDSKPSPTLWAPMLWIFMAGSRLPSQWMSGQVGVAASSLEEGNSLDWLVYTGLLLVLIAILASRSFNWGTFFAKNPALTFLVLYALLSVVWSDFPMVAFKRWFRDLGNYLAILVVLSDPQPMEAIRTVLRRSSYLLMALSMLLIKYYPQIGKQYEFWTGESHYVGVATSKNMLGVACLIAGLFFFWDTVLRWPNRRRRRTKKVIAINIVFLLMALLQLHQAASATSTVCLAMGCTIIAAANSKLSKRNPRFLEVLIPSGIAAYFLLTYGFDVNINSLVTSAVGRDSSFTGRTNIWSAVLSTHTNPLLGTGYESFWLGWRLEHVWKLAGHYNESHDGYLEMYLNLGFVGLAILFWLLVASFRRICNRMVKVSGPYYSFALALWTVLLFYNVTEAAFKGQLIWIIFLLVAIAGPTRASRNAAGKSRAARTREAAQQPALTA